VEKSQFILGKHIFYVQSLKKYCTYVSVQNLKLKYIYVFMIHINRQKYILCVGKLQIL
jgi:hypothetical protein